VEYAYYILIILCLMACILVIARVPARSRLSSDHVALADKARKQKIKDEKLRAKDEKRGRTLKTNRVMKRELSRVPTPWGWPRYDEDGDIRHGELDFSASLHRLADKLIHEKKTVQDQEYVDKRNASMRALLEDRYGRSSRMAEIKYNNVRKPMLRDPNAPHDQMDNFPSGKADEIEAKLRSQSGSQQGRELPWRREAPRSDLKNLKKPWGW
jgi:hypothetical protein